MTPTDKLLAIEEIRLLKARYFRFLDSHDWVGFRSIFADDAVFEMPVPPPQGNTDLKDVFTGGEPIKGGDAIIAWVSSRMDISRSAHIGYMPEIEIISATEAKALWGMEDIVRRPDKTIHGYGYYKERYGCEGGVWRIKRWSLFYKSMEITGSIELNHTPGRIVMP